MIWMDREKVEKGGLQIKRRGGNDNRRERKGVTNRGWVGDNKKEPEQEEQEERSVTVMAMGLAAYSLEDAIEKERVRRSLFFFFIHVRFHPCDHHRRRSTLRHRSTNQKVYKCFSRRYSDTPG